MTTWKYYFFVMLSINIYIHEMCARVYMCVYESVHEYARARGKSVVVPRENENHIIFL